MPIVHDSHNSGEEPHRGSYPGLGVHRGPLSMCCATVPQPPQKVLGIVEMSYAAGYMRCGTVLSADW